MTDRVSGRPRDATSRGRRATRRGFLALAGTTALAGCTDLGGLLGGGSSDDSPTLDGEAYADALSSDPPSVAETLPVEVERSHLDASAERAKASLSSVPAPLDGGDVPNGALRGELSRLYERATAELRDAREAPTPAETLSGLREARETARSAAAAWAAAEGDLTRDDVLGSVPDVRDAIDAFRRRWRYVGGEPVRALVVHGEVEALVASAFHLNAGARERSQREPENPITVGELAGRIESARAALGDAEYLFERYAGSLDDPRRIRDGLVAAGEELTATLDDRRADLPDGDPDDPSSYVDRDVEGTPVATALSDLRRGFDYADGLDDERATGRRASVALSAHETLVRVRAFESLRDRVSNGDHVVVASADDVREIRERAFAAVEDALESGGLLTRRVLAEVAGDFSYVEEQLRGRADGDDVSASWLDNDLAIYVLIGSMAREVPAVGDQVADVLGRTF